MSDEHDIKEQIKILQERVRWLIDLVWDSPTSFHKRLHTVEDVAGDAARDILRLHNQIEGVRKFVGMNGYGANMYTDLKDAVNSIKNLGDSISSIKGGIISTADFRLLVNKVDALGLLKTKIEELEKDETTLKNKVDALEKRDAAHITFRSYFIIAGISSGVGLIVQWIVSRLLP